MNRPLPILLATALHLAGAAVGFLASIMYFMAGLEDQGSFYAMITVLWLFTLGMRVIERFRRAPANKCVDELRRRP